MLQLLLSLTITTHSQSFNPVVECSRLGQRRTVIGRASWRVTWIVNPPSKTQKSCIDNKSSVLSIPSQKLRNLGWRRKRERLYRPESITPTTIHVARLRQPSLCLRAARQQQPPLSCFKVAYPSSAFSVSLNLGQTAHLLLFAGQHCRLRMLFHHGTDVVRDVVVLRHLRAPELHLNKLRR